MRWFLNQDSGYVVCVVLPQYSPASLKNQYSFLELHCCASISESYTQLDGKACCALWLGDTAYGS